MKEVRVPMSSRPPVIREDLSEQARKRPCDVVEAGGEPSPDISLFLTAVLIVLSLVLARWYIRAPLPSGVPGDGSPAVSSAAEATGASSAAAAAASHRRAVEWLESCGGLLAESDAGKAEIRLRELPPFVDRMLAAEGERSAFARAFRRAVCALRARMHLALGNRRFFLEYLRLLTERSSGAEAAEGNSAAGNAGRGAEREAAGLVRRLELLSAGSLRAMADELLGADRVAGGEPVLRAAGGGRDGGGDARPLAPRERLNLAAKLYAVAASAYERAGRSAEAARTRLGAFVAELEIVRLRLESVSADRSFVRRLWRLEKLRKDFELLERRVRDALRRAAEVGVETDDDYSTRCDMMLGTLARRLEAVDAAPRGAGGVEKGGR